MSHLARLTQRFGMGEITALAHQLATQVGKKTVREIPLTSCETLIPNRLCNPKASQAKLKPVKLKAASGADTALQW